VTLGWTRLNPYRRSPYVPPGGSGRVEAPGRPDGRYGVTEDPGASDGEAWHQPHQRGESLDPGCDHG